mmetsp:Transcript_54620/g.140609  ORF Transcript_54620/g.140609 Transcript_54620/m.140609 type:complete len:212 (-) Transcript_54620:485-1120(-)
MAHGRGQRQVWRPTALATLHCHGVLAAEQCDLVKATLPTSVASGVDEGHELGAQPRSSDLVRVAVDCVARHHEQVALLADAPAGVEEVVPDNVVVRVQVHREPKLRHRQNDDIWRVDVAAEGVTKELLVYIKNLVPEIQAGIRPTSGHDANALARMHLWPESRAHQQVRELPAAQVHGWRRRRRRDAAHRARPAIIVAGPRCATLQDGLGT